MNFLALLVPSLIPAFTDAFRGIIAKFTGSAGAQPQNVGEAISLMNAQTARLQAMADLDKPTGDVSQWVADFRALFRYVAILMIFVFTALSVGGGVPDYVILILLDMCGASMSFIIGERMYLKLKA